MCEMCSSESPFFIVKDIVDETFVFGFNDVSKINPVKVEEINYLTIGVCIDRGHLRLVNIDDCQCLDHGDIVKINFCPFCGEKLCS